MYIAHGGPESSDDPPTPPTPVTAPKAPALKPLEDLLAGPQDEEDSLIRRRVLLDAQLPPMVEDPDEPATEPTQRDRATPLSVQDEPDTPRTHRGPLDQALQTPLSELRASRSRDAEGPQERPGLWARIRAWLGL